jgi:hypothetical protein
LAGSLEMDLDDMTFLGAWASEEVASENRQITDRKISR